MIAWGIDFCPSFCLFRIFVLLVLGQAAILSTMAVFGELQYAKVNADEPENAMDATMLVGNSMVTD